jgi:hypothetical protein
MNPNTGHPPAKFQMPHSSPNTPPGPQTPPLSPGANLPSTAGPSTIHNPQMPPSPGANPPSTHHTTGHSTAVVPILEPMDLNAFLALGDPELAKRMSEYYETDNKKIVHPKKNQAYSAYVALSLIFILSY